MNGTVALQRASGTTLKFLVGLRRVIISSIAVVAMLVIYGLGSLGSYGVAALGLTGATGLALATSAQPAQAHRYRRRRRRRRWRGGWGWGPGIYSISALVAEGVAGGAGGNLPHLAAVTGSS